MKTVMMNALFLAATFGGFGLASGATAAENGNCCGGAGCCGAGANCCQPQAQVQPDCCGADAGCCTGGACCG